MSFKPPISTAAWGLGGNLELLFNLSCGSCSSGATKRGLESPRRKNCNVSVHGSKCDTKLLVQKIHLV